MKTAHMTFVRMTEMVHSDALKVFFGTVLLFASAQISIPLKPVPIVFTTVGVMLLGLLYSRKCALFSVLAYIAAGACGAPVFQGFTGGLRHFSGPTAGYIVGFFLAVLVMTSLRERFKLHSFAGMLLNCALGTITIFIPGVLWLSALIGSSNAWQFGVIPFIVPGIIKAVILSGFIKVLRRS